MGVGRVGGEFCPIERKSEEMKDKLKHSDVSNGCIVRTRKRTLGTNTSIPNGTIGETDSGISKPSGTNPENKISNGTKTSNEIKIISNGTQTTNSSGPKGTETGTIPIPRTNGTEIPPLLESPTNPPTYISQFDLAVTQYFFLGIVISHPWRVGAWGVSREELEGFNHYWRGLGYLLGISDKYNVCKGSLDETLQLFRELERVLVVPGLSAAGWDHEHMSRALIDGLGEAVPWLSYPSILRFLADTLDVPTPSLCRAMTWYDTLCYWLLRWVMHVLCLVPGVRRCFNDLLLRALDKVTREHRAFVKVKLPPIV